MIQELAASLEACAPAIALRQSTLAYPLVNAAHILGVALLVGGVVPLDLRLAGMWPRAAAQPLWRVLSRTAVCGFGIAVLSGSMLFMTRATEYAASALFQAKMVTIVLAGANAAWLAGRTGRALDLNRRGVHAAALLSAVLWVGVLVLGRLIGYF